jgi:hypothetical protein
MLERDYPVNLITSRILIILSLAFALVSILAPVEIVLQQR